MVCFNVIPQTIEYTIETVVILELRGRRAIELAEAALVRGGDMQMGRDHTFAQLTAMVADVRGSMMMPISGAPTRN